MDRTKSPQKDPLSLNESVSPQFSRPNPNIISNRSLFTPTRLTSWKDITALCDQASVTLQIGDMLHSTSFSLTEAMSAVEVLHPKMDVGYSKSDSNLDHISIPQDLSDPQVCAIMDKLLACEATWLNCHTLPQTIFTCLYMHSVDTIKSKSLRLCCKMVLTTACFARNIIVMSKISNEEDFIHYGFGFTLPHIPEEYVKLLFEHVVNTVDSIDYFKPLREKFRNILTHSHASDSSTSDIYDMQGADVKQIENTTRNNLNQLEMISSSEKDSPHIFGDSNQESSLLEFYSNEFFSEHCRNNAPLTLPTTMNHLASDIDYCNANYFSSNEASTLLDRSGMNPRPKLEHQIYSRLYFRYILYQILLLANNPNRKSSPDVLVKIRLARAVLQDYVVPFIADDNIESVAFDVNLNRHLLQSSPPLSVLIKSKTEGAEYFSRLLKQMEIIELWKQETASFLDDLNFRPCVWKHVLYSLKELFAYVKPTVLARAVLRKSLCPSSQLLLDTPGLSLNYLFSDLDGDEEVLSLSSRVSELLILLCRNPGRQRRGLLNFLEVFTGTDDRRWKDSIRDQHQRRYWQIRIFAIGYHILLGFDCNLYKAYELLSVYYNLAHITEIELEICALELAECKLNTSLEHYMETNVVVIEGKLWLCRGLMFIIQALQGLGNMSPVKKMKRKPLQPWDESPYLIFGTDEKRYHQRFFKIRGDEFIPGTLSFDLFGQSQARRQETWSKGLNGAFECGISEAFKCMSFACNLFEKANKNPGIVQYGRIFRNEVMALTRVATENCTQLRLLHQQKHSVEEALSCRCDYVNHRHYFTLTR